MLAVMVEARGESSHDGVGRHSERWLSISKRAQRKTAVVDDLNFPTGVRAEAVVNADVLVGPCEL
jgi:hypothetical protein